MANQDNEQLSTIELLRDDERFRRGLRARHRRGNVWKRFFQAALVIAFSALIALFFSIINSALGYIIEDYAVNPLVLAPDHNGDLNALTEPELVAILLQYQPSRLPVYIRDYLYGGDPTQYTSTPMNQALAGMTLPEGTESMTVTQLTPEQQAEILSDNMDLRQMVSLVETQVVVPVVLKTYSLTESIFQYDMIYQTWVTQFKDQGAVLRFYSWVNIDFITSPMSPNPASTGILTALLGTLWVVILTIVLAFPVGVGAAIYLEEYSSKDPKARIARFNSFVETNIRNLAGVPSIIYGLLGLAIFVRALSTFTGGRTILSAGLTMACLILPVIIINSQEAIRAVAPSLRDGSYGLGATKWQTIWKIVIPSSLPGILTGTILAMSRAIGETAPLIIIGASTFILTNPTSLMSKFTVLPILVYNWTSRPQQAFHDAAAAGIIVLLILLLLLNATAIFVRQRARRRLSA